MSLEFKDLSVFDLNLIKSNAVHILISTSINDRYLALADAVVSCVKAKGFNIRNEPKNIIKLVASYGTPAWNGSSSTLDADGVIALMFQFLSPTLIKDESRFPTWSTPSAAWYTEYDYKKKPWQI